MGLDLYAKIEPLLGFEEEKERLYALFIQKLQRLGIKSFLDIGCGNGAFMQKAMMHGLHCEGVDISCKMVETARKKGLTVYCKDICTIDKTYEAATAVFDVINYLDKKNLQKFFDCVQNILQKGGYFLCDMNTLFGFEEIAPGAIHIDTDEEFVALDAEFKKNRLVTDIVYFTKQNGCYKKEKGRIVQYYHDIHRIKKSGLRLVDMDFISLFGNEADKVLLTLKKG